MKSNPKVSGFALVVALGLMSFVVLLLVSMTTLVQVESANGQVAKTKVLAEQNAHFGAQIALGNLQRYAGPDQRITARASLWAADDRLVGANPSATSSWWIGISDSGSDQRIPQAIDSSGAPVKWLVSGIDENQTTSNQLTSGFPDGSVPIWAENSLDINLISGGNPIAAGRVPLLSTDQSEIGAFAWIVDDEGLKAKLKIEDTAVSNSTPAEKLPSQRSVLPGAFDFSQLSSLTELDPSSLEDLGKLNRFTDTLLLGLDEPAVRRHRFDYTTDSFGLLTNVVDGGLKVDLTAAFEDDSIFNRSFFDNGDWGSTYIVMNEEKLEDGDSSSLRNNGYIHWDIFKDYYNLKDAISPEGRLSPTIISKNPLLNSGTLDYRRGLYGPHDLDLGDGALDYPYGDFEVWSGLEGNSDDYKHSPITLVLGFLQQNAWIQAETDDPTPTAPGDPVPEYYAVTHSQLFSGVYNPYNVVIPLSGRNNSQGFRITGYPVPVFSLSTPGSSSSPSVPGDVLDRKIGMGRTGGNTIKTEIYENSGGSLLLPGVTKVYGFSGNLDSTEVVDGSSGTGIFNGDISASSDFSATRAHTTAPLDNGGVYDMRVEFTVELDPNASNRFYPFIAVGVGDTAFAGTSYPLDFLDAEISQVLYQPYFRDETPAFTDSTSFDPGYSYTVSKPGVLVQPGRMSSIDEAYFSLKLRTSRENSTGIRPLVDGNLRAIWGNPRWDSPLGLDVLASYSQETLLTSDSAEDPNPNLDVVGEDALSYWGGGYDPFRGSQRVILFDIPREDLVSIGQLQHAGASRFSYEPAYVVGNSYSNLRIPLDQWSTSISDTFGGGTLTTLNIPDNFRLYDASYLVNEKLFEGYTFSTIQFDQPESYYEDLLNGAELLANPRYIPYKPEGFQFDKQYIDTEGRGDAINGAEFRNAGMLMVDGAFNVNSTSVDAWEAFLSGTDELPVRRVDGDGNVNGFLPVTGVRFPRVASVLGSEWSENADANYWTGFRSLSPLEVRELAQAIVDEIRARGPALSFAQFINRKLEVSDEGRVGILQAALDATINNGISGEFESNANRALYSNISEDSTQGAGFPGQLLQGDLLQALAPYMTVRSDTFTIRTYGEALNFEGNVDSSAWREIVVQRLPDPVSTSGALSSLDLINPQTPFGRKFKVISSRWLDSTEI